MIISTSLPVINLVKEQKVSIDDAAFTYNRIEIFIAILVGIFTGFAQFLRYKSTGKGIVLKKLWLPTVIALVLSLSISFWGGIHYDKYGAGFLAAIHIACSRRSMGS